MVSDDCHVLGAPQPFCFTGCGDDKEQVKSGGPSSNAPVVSVVVTRVVQKTVPIYTELTARTDANDSVEIRARVKAFLQQSYAEGRWSRRGRCSFTLDKREYEAQAHAGRGAAGQSAERIWRRPRRGPWWTSPRPTYRSRWRS